MKKEKIVFVIALITILISSIISVYAANYLYNSQEVEYDNTGKNIASTNVQGAIDELYIDANNYSSINTRVTNLESYFSNNTGTLNITGNPVKINGTSIGDYYTITTYTFYTTLKVGLNAHSGNTVDNLLTEKPSVSVPNGYTLVAHVDAFLSGCPGVSYMFDGLIYASKTSDIGGYIFNSSNNNYPSGTYVQLKFISLWKKS